MEWLGKSRDIVLDSEAFDKAIRDLDELASKLNILRTDMEGMLQDLQAGFDTPAGRKFIGSCKNNLLEPMDRQKLVLEHISRTLAEVKGKYTPVFGAYNELNATINSFKR